jgi:hypothetical protein
LAKADVLHGTCCSPRLLTAYLSADTGAALIIEPVEHPSGIPDKIVRKVVARRGRLHAFEHLNPGRTALVAIDLDEATIGGSDGACRQIIPVVNRLAKVMRATRGTVAWVLSHQPVLSPIAVEILGEATAS